MTDRTELQSRPGAPGGASGRVVAVVNPASGSASGDDDLRAALIAALADQTGGGGAIDLEIVPTTEDDPGAGQCRAAVESGASTVVACGGDGTVRACLEPLADRPVALGIVPLGTGNLLASNLDLGTGLDAVDAAVNGPVRVLDLAEVNGEAFAVMAGSGFDAMMIRDADSTTKRRFGSVAYVISAARNLPTRLVRTTVSVDDAEVWTGRTAMVLVGNCGTVTGGMQVFPDARPDDGVLDVAVLSARTVRQWASVLWRLVRGRQQRPDLVARFRGRTVVVRTDEARPYELDGEDRPPADVLRFAVRPGALRVHAAVSATTGDAAPATEDRHG
jgi:YegS/Rv2252/BmrU family lipid kinase